MAWVRCCSSPVVPLLAPPAVSPMVAPWARGPGLSRAGSGGCSGVVVRGWDGRGWPKFRPCLALGLRHGRPRSACLRRCRGLVPGLASAWATTASAGGPSPSISCAARALAGGCCCRAIGLSPAPWVSSSGRPWPSIGRARDRCGPSCRGAGPLPWSGPGTPPCMASRWPMRLDPLWPELAGRW